MIANREEVLELVEVSRFNSVRWKFHFKKIGKDRALKSLDYVEFFIKVVSKS